MIKIILASLLLWALADNPYIYYQLLRWIVCGFTGYFSWQYFEKKQLVLGWVFAIIAIVFNPLAPLRFDREAWAVIDVFTALVLLSSILLPQLKPFMAKLSALINTINFKVIANILNKIYTAFVILLLIWTALYCINWNIDKKHRENIKQNLNLNIG